MRKHKRRYYSTQCVRDIRMHAEMREFFKTLEEWEAWDR